MTFTPKPTGAPLLCTGRYPRSIFDFVLGPARERRDRRASGAAPKPLTAMPLIPVLLPFAGCIACSM
jgi:hypothetical protein